jgi:type IV secretion system protein VirB9
VTTNIAIRSTLAVVLLMSVPHRVHSAETPVSCGEDPRQRCIAYKPGQIINLMLSPGATMTIELPPDEVVFSLGASDNGIITGEGQAERVAAGAQTTTDPNLLVSVPGDVTNPSGFIMMKALRHLEPQPYHVIGRWTNPVTGKLEYRHHSFELRTIPGGPEQADAFYTVVFSDPVAEKVRRDAKRREAQEQRAVREAADRLAQVQISTLQRNIAYDGQGTEVDRAALAPAAPAGLDAMWDDGQRTFLRYPGNRAVAVAYQVLADGTEAVIGQSTVIDAATHGSLLIIHGVMPMMRLRSGESVLCITNRAYDPVGRNTGTGTVDPGVVRDARGS